MIEVSHCRMMFATELKNVKRGRIIERKKVFLRNARYFLMEGKKFLMLLGVAYSYSKPHIYALVISKEY